MRAGLERILNTQGFTLARTGGDYLSAADAITAAKAKGQTVREYVEELWEQVGAAERVANEFQTAGALAHCDRVLEVGPGTGMFLEYILARIKPKQYDIYETAADWASYLAQHYAPTVVRQPADGVSLKHTPNASCGLVHGHGVYVYIKPLQSFEYFNEMMRVCTPGGYIAFDFFSAEKFTAAEVTKWLSFPDRYPILLPDHAVKSAFAERGYSLIHQFDHKLGRGKSQYVIFKASES
jgi:SAM-dependent methyltransferase